MQLFREIDENGYPWLALWLAFSLFASGRTVIPVTVWLAPLFLLRFIRGRPSGRRVALVVLGLIPCSMFNWNGVVPGSLWILFQITAFISLALSTGYVLDWLANSRLGAKRHSLLSTLVIPLAYTASEFILSLVNPYSSFAALAYTQ
jgi:apolipoprotein N-acyltransferase